MYCFERGSNTHFIQKAAIYKSSVLLRKAFFGNSVEVNALETLTAKAVNDLLSHGLSRGATNLLELLLPFLPENDQTKLKELVLEHLPTNSRDFM